MVCHKPKCGCFLLKACVSSLLTTNFTLGLCALIFLIIMFCQPDCFVSTLKTYNLAGFFFFLSSLYLDDCLVCGDFQGYLLLLVLKHVVCKVILFPGDCQNCLCRVSAGKDTKSVIRGLNRTRVENIPPSMGQKSSIYLPVPMGITFTVFFHPSYLFSIHTTLW